MIPELGHFSLILALGLATMLAVVPMLGVSRNNMQWMNLGGSLATGLFVFVSLSFGCLMAAFVNDDFSVSYVARNSNTQLPVFYKVSAVWGAHEGSFLLWILVATGWTFAVSFFSRGLPLDMRARVLSVLGALSVGFLLFILFTSNPFDRSLPVFPSGGSGLSPLVQDIGLIVHPPLLYMGYAGFSVPFAFAIAALLSGRLDAAWAKWSRPWANTAWAFLAAGITLGSWWAYYELGWGGWWFWDAVENASFMPWLVGTALIHSLAASEKRGVFKTWTVLLAIFAFSLSLLGAFLVRSGVLTSVHAFAVDPARGMFILAFLVVVIGGSLALFAVRVGSISNRVGFSFVSRESFMLVNNVLLLVAAAAVLLGTIYPLIYEAMTGGKKISVGPPYFNTVFVPIVFVLLVFMVLGPHARWKTTSFKSLIRSQVPLLAISLVSSIGLLLVFAPTLDLLVLLSVFLSLWIILALLLDLYAKVSNKQTYADRLKAILRFSPSYWGMLLGHLGIAVAVAGVCLTSYYSDEIDVRVSPGESVTLGELEFLMVAVDKVKGPNYIADRGDFEVRRNGKYLFNLNPEKRVYGASGQPMTEADIDPGLFRDIYVALGEPLGVGGAWAVRVHHKPFVRWIWGGGLLLSIGGLLTVLDRRYRLVRARRTAEVQTESPGGTQTGNETESVRTS
jgi:cytochrome c-type biogenesis protein CcmF